MLKSCRGQCVPNSEKTACIGTWDSCYNRPNPRLWEMVQQKAPMYCHGNLGGWRFQGEREYMLNEVK